MLVFHSGCTVEAAAAAAAVAASSEGASSSLFRFSVTAATASSEGWASGVMVLGSSALGVAVDDDIADIMGGISLEAPPSVSYFGG